MESDSCRNLCGSALPADNAIEGTGAVHLHDQQRDDHHHGHNGPGGDVTIPDTIDGLQVTSIGDGAFFRISNLNEVHIQANITYIGSPNFSDCPAILVDVANTFYSSVDGVLFDKGQTTLRKFPQGKGGSYIVPDGTGSSRRSRTAPI
jgi:hypothetical protein